MNTTMNESLNTYKENIQIAQSQLFEHEDIINELKLKNT